MPLSIYGERRTGHVLNEVFMQSHKATHILCFNLQTYQLVL